MELQSGISAPVQEGTFGKVSLCRQPVASASPAKRADPGSNDALVTAGFGTAQQRHVQGRAIITSRCELDCKGYCKGATIRGCRCSCPALQLAEALLLRELALSWCPDLLPLWLSNNHFILLCKTARTIWSYIHLSAWIRLIRHHSLNRKVLNSYSRSWLMDKVSRRYLGA